MYFLYFSRLFGVKTSHNRPGSRDLASVLLVTCLLSAPAFACQDRKPNLPSHLAQKSALELNQAGLQLHARESYKHSAVYFEFATMQNPGYYEGHFNRARALARTNDIGEALTCLETAYRLNAGWVLERLTHPDLDSLREDAGFARILNADVAARQSSLSEGR